MKKKSLSGSISVFLFAILLSTVVIMTSYGGSSEDIIQNNAAPADTAADEIEETEETEPEYPHLDTSVLDFGGKTLTFISPE